MRRSELRMFDTIGPVALAAAAAVAPLSPLSARQHDHPQPAGAGAEHQARMQHNRHLLVTAAWLMANPESAVVVHVGRSDSAYLAAHIPGARFLPLAAVAATVNGVANEFPAPDEMARAFAALVIPPGARIVLYGDDPGLLAARAWVALDLMGHGERAALLDGGLEAWRRRGGGLERGPIVLPAVHYEFPVRWQAERVVNAAWVRSRLGDSTVLFVDARPEDQFGGAEPACPAGPASCVQIPDQRRGHIPGSRNLYWMRALVSRTDPLLLSLHALHHELWEPIGAGAPHVRTIVTYCRTGMQASHSYFQARYIGYRDVRLYDGSFAEWSALNPAEYPVAR